MSRTSMSLAAAGPLAACAILFLPAPRAARADCAGTPFADQVRSAAVIFAGTLDRVDVEHSTRFAGSVSRLRFQSVQYAKGGGPAKDLLVTQPGVVGLMADLPSFDLGVRYVAFADQPPGNARSRSKPPLAATSCTSFHPFTVQTDSLGAETVRDDLGRLVVAVRPDRIVLLARRSWDPDWPWVERDSSGAAVKPRLAGDWRDGSLEVRVLWPEDDPGTRVGEGDLLRWLRGIADGMAAAPDSVRTD